MHSAARPAVEVRRLNNIQDLIGCQGVELTGLDKAVYAEQPADDIVALRREMYQDPVSEFIARNLFPSIAHIFSRKPKKTANGEFQKFRGAVIQVFGSALSTVSAAGYLIAAIVTLYYTPSMSSKLAVIAIFTFFHALILSFFRPTNVDSINAVSTSAPFPVY